MDAAKARAYACLMLRLRRFVVTLATLAFLAGMLMQTVHAVAVDWAGGAVTIGTAQTASNSDCDHRDDRGDRSMPGTMTCKAICVAMPMVLPPGQTALPNTSRPVTTHLMAAPFLTGLTDTPDPPPPRPTAIV